jgi:hypothetical protein
MTQDPGAPLRADARASSVKSESERRSSLAARPTQDDLPTLNAADHVALSEPIIIAEFPKNRRGDSVRITLKRYEGHNLVDVRQFFSIEGRTPRPTSKGVTVNVRCLPQLASAISHALMKAHELGLIESEATA